MIRVRATAAVALALSAGVAHADDNWKATKPAAPVAPPVVVPDVPAIPQWSAPKAEGPVWGPAKGGEPVAAPPTQEPAPPPKPAGKPADPSPLPVPRTLPPTQPAPAATKPTPAAAKASTAVWGGARYWPDNATVLEPAPKVVPADGAPPPIRHGTFGSPNVTLSRDYHVLDLVGAGLLAEDGNTVVPNEGPPTSNYFFETEYLLWWVRRGDIPVLATTAPNTTNPNANFGFLGRPGTSILLPAGPFGDSFHNGFRVRAGGWFDEWWSGCGLDGSFFYLGRRSDTFAVNSAQTPVITRPFFAPNIDPRTGQVFGEFGEVVAGGGTAGSLAVNLDSRLWGADVNVKSCLCRTCDAHTEWFLGYRHLNLREDLSVTEAITSGPLDAPTFPLGTRIVVNDTFSVRNQFHGGQIGYASGRRWGRLDVDVRASVALGVTHQELEIAGNQTVLPPGQATPSVFTGGLLATGPNLGSFTDNKFSVAPEFTLTAGYMVTPNLRLSVGYNFLYWTNVLRPGEQIDRVVDPTFVPNFNLPAIPSGQNRPQPLFNQSDLWVQGVQFGVQLRW